MNFCPKEGFVSNTSFFDKSLALSFGLRHGVIAFASSCHQPNNYSMNWYKPLSSYIIHKQVNLLPTNIALINHWFHSKRQTRFQKEMRIVSSYMNKEIHFRFTPRIVDLTPLSLHQTNTSLQIIKVLKWENPLSLQNPKEKRVFWSSRSTFASLITWPKKIRPFHFR